MKKKPCLERSLDWIRAHPNAMNLDVPGELVAMWIYDDDQEETNPPGFYLTVFTFGFFQQELISGNLPAGRRHEMPAARLLECFTKWQMKLALVEIHRKTDLSVKPLPLFGYPENEKISYWHKEPPPAGDASAP